MAIKLDILGTDGKSTGKKATLPEEVFGIEPNEHVLYLAVKGYLASQRTGTHKSKERGEVAGSTRKIKRQKGTGGARAGSIKNPLFRHGGTIFGPRPRDYDIKLNKKVRNLARKSALSAKAKDNQIMVLENMNMEEIKTKSYVDILKNLGVDKQKSLVVVADKDRNLYMSSKNVSRSKVTLAADMNVYDILNADMVILSVDSVEKIKEVCNNQA